jgi:alkylhydroperoxidase family enzyme
VAQLDDHASSDLPERTKAALAWADVMLAGGSDADPAVVEQLQKHFSDDEVVELTFAIGTFIGYSKQIIVLGLEPPEMPLTVLDTPGA